MYTFGVFFKPLASDLGSSRAALSGAYSLFMLNNGIFSMVWGHLSDRFGPARTGVLSGFLMALGLALSSQVNSLWQFYLTYGLLAGIGMGGNFSIAMGTTARWFHKKRGMALGIVAAGAGIGTLIILPLAERLIAAYGWSGAYLTLGVTIGVIVITSALFLRSKPADIGLQPYGFGPQLSQPEINKTKLTTDAPDTTVRNAARTRFLGMLLLIYFLFSFGQQMIMVHLVNYTTDQGIIPIVAATLVSVIGIGGIAGRTGMGAVSDRIGSKNALLVCCIILTLSLVWLIFTRELWMFYLFAIVFGFAYGGEVPQMPTLIGEFFGLGAVSALVGTIVFAISISAALGSWAGGQIFDTTHSYTLAFIIAVICSFSAVLTVIMLKKMANKRRRS